MLTVLSNAWALLLGMLLLMMGNGMQGTLLGLRGDIEGFDPSVLSYVMAAYFLGFLGGSRLAPRMIRRVGHVRVFAALASLISAAFVIYAAAPTIWVWFLMRLLTGFCFSAVYVVAESWLNDSADNATRGKALSAYMVIQLAGVVAAQGLVTLGDPGGYNLFILISVLVSVAVAPILLSASPAPVFETTRRMSFQRLYRVSPLAFVGALALGGVFSAMFGMAAVYGTEVGLGVTEIAIFVATIYAGGMVLQYPIGLLSDRMDRRLLIIAMTLTGGAAAAYGAASDADLALLLGAAALVGGTANPLYSLLIAYANDYLEHEDMAAASSGLVFMNGLGAVGGPVIVGYLMDLTGPSAFFAFIAVLMSGIGVYGLWRMLRRPARPSDESGAYAPVAMSASPVSVEIAQDYAIDRMQSDEEASEPMDPADGSDGDRAARS